MADYEAVKSKHATLTGTDEDVVTLAWRPYVEILNRSGTADLTVRVGGGDTAPEADEDDTEVVPAGSWLVLPAGGQADTVVVHVVGDGNAYSVSSMSEVA